MGYQTITLENRNRIAYLTLNRPNKLNAFNERMMEELMNVFTFFDSDRDTSVVVITGAGRAFSAGMDLRSDLMFVRESEGESTFLPPFEIKESLLKQHQIISKLRNLNQITIASVNGVCCGGSGFGLALACDIRIASEKAEFWWAANVMGMIQDYGGTHTLAKLVGTAKALELLCTGDHINGQDAERLGIVNRIVPHENLKQATDEMASKIARGAPLSIPMMKRLVYGNVDTGLETALFNEAVAQALTLTTDDAQGGMLALLERKMPQFEGK